MKNDALHIIPILDTVILPHTETKLAVDENLGEELMNQLEHAGGYALAITLKDGVNKQRPTIDSFYKIGSIVKIEKIERSSEGYLVYVQGIERIELQEVIPSNIAAYGTYVNADESEDLSEESKKQMVAFIKEAVREISSHYNGNEEYLRLIDRQKEINPMITYLLPYLQISLDKKYELIRLSSNKQRGLLLIEYLARQREEVELQVEMAKKYSKEKNTKYREAMLREQLRAIRQELGEMDDDPNNPDNYEKRIEESDMPEEVRKVALKELRKLESAGNNNSESYGIRNYLDLVLELPWKSNIKDVDIHEARRVLNDNHYGMEKVKERIIQHLAVMKVQNEKQGSILLLVGPPGTGKTSLGKSIAEALGREYVRASLGGVRDEAEIRGHRRTYIGALPGRIIQGMKKAGTKNPVFVLDEVDKLTSSYNGDPTSALLEVLDPEQNDSFADHYLEVPYDLSDVLFIATANNLNSIPGPLLDRLEVIQISSYTNMEKLHIAKEHLVRESLNEHGLVFSDISFSDEVIQEIVDKYTREAGVRNLRKQIDKVVRSVIEKNISKGYDFKNEENETIKVGVNELQELLGHEVARHSKIKEAVSPGVVTGLAWTPVGGDILFIEGTFMNGKGNMLLTGQLGDVMKESARIALSLVKSRLADQMKMVDFSKNDIHIHVPSGSTPKDGPSAGVTLLTALASLATGKKVNTELAMTGEITLSGNVTPVGGIKEKVLAAHRAGVKTILLPKDNEKDVLDVPEDARNEMEFIYVETIEQVLEKALDIKVKSYEDIFQVEEDTAIGFKMV